MAAELRPTGGEQGLYQKPPGGDIAAYAFGAIALLMLLGIVRSPPTLPWVALVDLVLVLAFAVPALILYLGARRSGVFVTDERVEYRTLLGVRGSWTRGEVTRIEAMSGGLKLLGSEDRVLRRIRFRWWHTEDVAHFARATGLAAPSALELAAAQAQPGKAGEG
jgi:hypothetical protein